MTNLPIPPLNTLVNLQPVAVSNSAQNATQPNVLSNVPNGTLISGFVINRDTQNQPILRTDLGDVLITTPLFLKTGTEVVLRVDTTQPNHARLISINGQTPETFTKLQAAQATVIADDIITSAPLPTEANPIPKPVQIAGALLKFQPEASLPPALIESALKTLGIARGSAANEAQPLAVVIRAILNKPQVQPAGQPPITPNTQNQFTQPPIPTKGQPAIPTQPATVNAAAQAIPNTETAGAKPSITPLPPSPSETEAPPPQNSATPIRTSEPPQSQAKPNISTPLPTLDARQPDQAPAQPSLAHTLLNEVNAPTTKTPNLSTPAIVSQQNLLSAQSLLVDEAQPPAQAPLPPEEPAAMLKADLAPQVRQARMQQTMPLPPTIEAHEPGEVHPAFRNLLPNQQMNITPQNSVRMDAQVIGQESKGDTILHTPLGIVKVFTPKPLPVGSALSIEVRPSVEPHIPAQSLPSSLPDDMQELTQLARDWPALTDVLDELKSANPQAYQQVLQNAVPTTGKNLTHGMLFFLSALKGGDVKQWLGNKALEISEAKQPGLMKRIAGEFSGLYQASLESSNQGWMTTIIPVMHENVLHQARMYVRHEAEDEEKTASQHKGGQRFIIEVDLTQMGEMQFDGFVLKESGRHQFDMVVRSTRPLPLDIQQDIRNIYDNSASIAGFKGMLTFQSTREQFVRPLNTMKRDTTSGILA